MTPESFVEQLSYTAPQIQKKNYTSYRQYARCAARKMATCCDFSRSAVWHRVLSERTLTEDTSVGLIITSIDANEQLGLFRNSRGSSFHTVLHNWSLGCLLVMGKLISTYSNRFILPNWTANFRFATIGGYRLLACRLRSVTSYRVVVFSNRTHFYS